MCVTVSHAFWIQGQVDNVMACSFKKKKRGRRDRRAQSTLHTGQTDKHSLVTLPAGLQAKEKARTLDMKKEGMKMQIEKVEVMVSQKHKQKRNRRNGNIISSTAHTKQILLWQDAKLASIIENLIGRSNNSSRGIHQCILMLCLCVFVCACLGSCLFERLKQ